MAVDYSESVADLENRIRAHKLYSKTSLEKILADCLELVQERATVLDLGCGSGNFYDLFSSLDRNYIGIDISSELLIEFRSKQPKTIILIESSMDSLPLFHESSFDAVFSVYSIYYSLQPRILVQNLQKSLCKNGRLFVIGPSMKEHACEISKFCNTLDGSRVKTGKKNSRIDNFHNIIIPEITRKFSLAGVSEIDGSLYFPNATEWAKYVTSTPQVRECTNLDRNTLLELAEEFSQRTNNLSVSKHITIATARK